MNLHLDDFTQHLQTQERSVVTIAGYCSDMTLFARWFEGAYSTEFSPDLLTQAVVRAYKQHLLDQQAKPQTVNRRLASLAAYGHWAMLAGHLPEGRNPVQGVRKVAEVPHGPRWLTRQERAALLRAIEAEVQRAMLRYPRLQVQVRRDAAITLLMLNTGLRLSEVYALNLEDVVLGERSGKVTVRSGKGGKYRQAPLNAGVRRALRRYLVVRPEGGENGLFLGAQGQRVSHKTLQRAVNRFAAKAGLEDVSPHVLRHTFAKSLVDKGVSLEKVAALLGHSDLNTTRIYTTPGERDLQDAVDGLG